MSRERIVVLSGPKQGCAIDLGESLSIGRSPDNLLQLNDLQISRKHAVIEKTPSGTVVRDLGSGNGTFVGNQRVLEYRLAPGDIISVGSVSLSYEVVDDSHPPAEPAPRSPGQPGGLTARSKGPGASASVVRFQNRESARVEASSAENVYRTFFEMPREAADMAELRQVQERLAAVYEANQIISSERDLAKLFERVMDQLFALVPAHNGVIMLFDEAADEMVMEHIKSGSGQTELVVSSTIVARAFEGGEAVLTSDATGDDRFDAGASIISHNIASAMCVPLTYQSQRLGVIYVDTRGTTNAFDQGDLQLLVALSGAAAIAIKNAQYLAMLEASYQDTLTALANAINMRDHYTVGHTVRVTNFAKVAAQEMGWDEEKLKECEMGGILHDVGKIAVDDVILRKPSGLTDEEYAKMKVHPERGARLMEDIPALVPLIPYALCHHEHYNGKGYPYGRKGEEIPIEGRLMAVADTFDAMTSNRPYRKGLDPEIAIAELEKCKGSQFDPAVVDAFVRSYRAGRIEEILQEYHKGGRSIACPFCSTFIPVGDTVEVGDEMQCAVCHRRVRLCMANEAYYGELIAGTAPQTATLPKKTTQ